MLKFTVTGEQFIFVRPRNQNASVTFQTFQSQKSNEDQDNIQRIYTSKDKENFPEELHTVVDRGLKNNEQLILMRNFNARIGKDVIPKMKQKFNERINNQNAERMVTFYTTNVLRVNNKYTFTYTRTQNSMIDYVVTNRAIHYEHILDMRSMTTPNAESDRCLVLCMIRFKEP